MPNPDFTKDAQERARDVMDRWHSEANEVALKSLDPAYLKDLAAVNGLTRLYADFMGEIVADEIRQAEQAAREKALEDAAGFLDDKLDRYPTKIFPEPPPGEHGKTVDSCSASALRAMAPIWAEEIRALKDQK